MNVVTSASATRQPAWTIGAAVAGVVANWAPTIGAFAVIVALSALNITLYPRIGFDEGVFLTGARTLAQTGSYGTQSADGLKLFDAMLTTGPTVIAPVAILFKVFGAGLLPARLISVLYLLLAAVGLYRVAHQLSGRAAAVLAILAFAALGEAGPFANGRPVLGEIAALAYLFWGSSFFISAQLTRKPALYVLTGLSFGLAILTKNQFVLLGLVVIGVWLATRRFPTGVRFPHLLLLIGAMAVPLIVWFGYQLAVLGLLGFVEQVRGMLGQAGVSGATGPLRRTQYAIHFLATSGASIWVVAALAYGWATAIKSGDWRRPERLVLLAFASAWLGAFVFISAGWPRYAVPTVVTASLVIGQFFADTAKRFRVIAASGSRGSWKAVVNDPLLASVLTLLGLMLASGIFLNAWQVARARDDSPQQFAASLARAVPQEAVVETMEWEISFLSDRTFHHPPVDLVVDGTKKVFLDGTVDTVNWYSAPPDATFLVRGPMAKLIGAYAQDVGSGHFVVVANVGEYDLLRRIN